MLLLPRINKIFRLTKLQLKIQREQNLVIEANQMGKKRTYFNNMIKNSIKKITLPFYRILEKSAS
jgi:hypothetical protein